VIKIKSAKTSKLKLVKDKTIKKEDFNNTEEYKFKKATELIPKKSNKLICMFFTEDKGSYFILRKFNNKNDSFHFNKGLYIIDNEAIHITKNGNRICFYLQGISTPIKMSNIERFKEEVVYKDLQGNERKSIVQKIKGLKFDSKILEIFTDRKLAENFTSDNTKNLMLIIMILSIVSVVMIGICIGVSYYFK
jgi:hypothetical protein